MLTHRSYRRKDKSRGGRNRAPHTKILARKSAARSSTTAWPAAARSAKLIAAGGSAVATVVSLGGTELVASGGSSLSATVESGGTQIVESHGHAGVTTLNGGKQIVEAGGAATSVIISAGTVDALSGGTANVAFLPAGSGGLIIADTSGSTAAYTGTVSGFGGTNHLNSAQFIDLINVTSDSTVSATFGGGVLTVSSGTTVVARIHLIGTYSAGDFSATSGISGTVAIVDPTVSNGGSVEPGPVPALARHGIIDLPNIAFGAQTTLAYAENSADTGGTLTVTDGRHAAAIALLGNYMAASFVTGADGHGGTLVSQPHEQTLLTHPLAHL
jgi:autotransporter passenger strand-loop-strand repeat protein